MRKELNRLMELNRNPELEILARAIGHQTAVLEKAIYDLIKAINEHPQH